LPSTADGGLIVSITADISDKIGRKWTMAICYVLLFAGITVEVISHSQSNPNAVFFAGKLINGFAIGGLLATALTYIGEVSLHSASASRRWGFFADRFAS
jgi:MFS family permease